MDNTDEIDTVAKKVNDLEQKLKEIDSNSTTNINTTTTNIKRELEVLQEELKVMHHGRQFNIIPERRNQSFKKPDLGLRPETSGLAFQPGLGQVRSAMIQKQPGPGQPGPKNERPPGPEPRICLPPISAAIVTSQPSQTPHNCGGTMKALWSELLSTVSQHLHLQQKHHERSQKSAVKDSLELLVMFLSLAVQDWVQEGSMEERKPYGCIKVSQERILTASQFNLETPDEVGMEKYMEGFQLGV
eukprot:scaffold12644_cov43-Cyclotella_meneghiniana.AAC.7